MKKIIYILFLAVTLSSCYDDFTKDFDYNAAYFAFQYDVRTIVIGEDSTFQFGVAFGGVKVNSVNREVGFMIDPTLISPATLLTMKGGTQYLKDGMAGVALLKQLPSNYYSLSADKFVIPIGEHIGAVTLKVNDLFIADTAAVRATYAIPIRLTTKVGVDSILPLKSTSVIGVKFESMLFGNYWHGGVMTRDSLGTIVKPINYYTTIPSALASAWKLTTVSPTSMIVNGVGTISSSTKPEMKLTLQPDGKVLISSMPGATYTVLPNGESTYNKAKLLQNRKLFLNYKFVSSNGIWHYAKDTLTFRNRIRDGVNEWQDENPAHYN